MKNNLAIDINNVAAIQGDNAANMDDAPTRGQIRAVLHYLRSMSDASTKLKLVKAGLCEASEATRKVHSEETMRINYNVLEQMLMRDIPPQHRLSAKHFDATYTSLRTGGIPAVLLDPENNVYEVPRAKSLAATKVLEFLNILEDGVLFVLAIGYETHPQHMTRPITHPQL